MNQTSPPLPTLPLVGRGAELAMLRQLLDDADSGEGRTLILAGETGVGKTRLTKAAADEASRRGWNVAVGRAYPVETGVPYAPISDAMLPLLSKLSPEALGVLTRGGDVEILHLFPALRTSDTAPRVPDTGAAEFKTRLLWNFSQFLCRLATKQPLLLILEDLQWADASSLELLHFVARQVSDERIAVLCTYNEAQRDQSPALRRVEQSLVSLDTATVHPVGPLSRSETNQLVREAFDAEDATVREFTALLHGWTQGNPFFLEQTLKSLVQSGRLVRRDGGWQGWELEEIQLPRSIRDVVIERLEGLSPAARAVADLHAVIGTSATYEVLHSVSPIPEPEFVTALDELRREHVVAERAAGDALVYDFIHPVVRDTLYAELGLARARLLHGTVAEALETFYGDATLQHADELAFHYSRANARHLAPKARRYLSIAGHNALARHAYREAADYLGAALELASSAETGSPDAGDAEANAQLIQALGRARQRLGDYDGAIALWERARAEVERRGTPADIAGIELRLGLAHHWSGGNPEALVHYDAGLAAAGSETDEQIRARLRLAKGELLQETGKPDEARAELSQALELAERDGDIALLGRIHRALLLLYTWTGPPTEARRHGTEALALAEQAADRALGCTTHWALAVLEGFTGRGAATARHIGEAERLADELRSPLHRLWITEISVEYFASTGDWDTAITLGERAIKQARVFNQRSLLSRLLVWVGRLYFARGEIELGKRYVDEAWELSGAGREPGEGAVDLHTVVPAHTGHAAYHLAIGEYEEAVRIGEAGLAIADRSGYTVWAIHRLLPIIAEASLLMFDTEGAARVGARLRRESERLGHKLGLAWADACDALLVWLGEDLEGAITLLREAAERLEMIPVVPDAARLRRQYAARLRDYGDREEALRQLRQIHETFVRLGAERELAKTREQIRELGARPPTREAGVGVAGLTAREVDIVRLVRDHRSNKAIGSALDISARTVSTHLSHIFRKLNVSSRVELAELARTMNLPAD